MNQIQACITAAVSALPDQALLLQSTNGRVRAVFLPPARKVPAKIAAAPVPVATPAPHTEKPVETPDARAWRELCSDLNRLSQRSSSVQEEVARLIQDIRDAKTLSLEVRSKMLTRVEGFVCMKMQQKFLAEENLPLTEASSLAIQHDARIWMDGVLGRIKPKAQSKAKSTPAPKPKEKRAPKPRGFASLESVLGYLARPHIILHTKGGGHQVVESAHLTLTNAA